jgi:two-component system CheB/CheR fusion protein
MLDQALRHSQPAITERRQKLTIERPTQALRLSADARRLVGVFAALLDNASRYTGEGGSISLNTHVSDTAVEIRVRDSGIGIPEEALPRIFDIFAGRTRVHHGFGVSLAIARRVIEAHGGTLRASSAGPGRGSEFVVRLPRNAARSAAALSVQPAHSTASMAAARVLIVDDNAAFRSSLSALVHDWGHEVALAASGPEAMERAAQFQPQWVLLDANLPGDNGYQVARQLRRLSAGESMHVVLMSGNAPNEVSRRAAKDAGCDECIDKLHFDAFERLLRPSVPA